MSCAYDDQVILGLSLTLAIYIILSSLVFWCIVSSKDAKIQALKHHEHIANVAVTNHFMDGSRARQAPLQVAGRVQPLPQQRAANPKTPSIVGSAVGQFGKLAGL